MTLLRRLAGPIGAGLVGLLVLAVGLAALGFDVPRALTALWQGAFGSWYAVTSATMVRAVPLIVIGLGIAIAFRAGALNIGAEGQFYAGAIAAAWVGVHLGGRPAVLAIPITAAVAMAAGFLWITIPVLLRVRFGVLEVISTLLLNFVAEALVSFMVLGPLQESKRIYPQSDPVALAARLPQLPGTRLHLGFVVALVLAVAIWIVMTKTVWGFRIRAVGEGPQAARVTGRINVSGTLAAALWCSGAIAGLAGALEVSGVTYALYPNLSPGYGFTAIAVALMAGLHPLGIVATGLGFGALEAGALGMQRDAEVPAAAVYVVQAVIIVVILLGLVRRRPSRAAQET